MDLAETAREIANSYVPPVHGRPAAIQNADTVQALLTYIEAGMYPEVAAELADIGESTLRLWLKRGEDGEPPFDSFLRAVKRAEAKAELTEIGKVRRAGENPQYWTASMTFLERRAPNRWGRRSEPGENSKITINIGLQGSPAPVITLQSTSPEPQALPPATDD